MRRAVLALAAFLFLLPTQAAHAATGLTTTTTRESWCRYGVRCVQRHTITTWGLPGLCGTPADVVVIRRHAPAEYRTATTRLDWTPWRVVRTYHREHAC